MSDFEMEAIDQQVENLANSKHEEACENPAPETEGKPGFWQQLDNEIHYTRYRRKRQIVAVLWVLACLAAAAALVVALYVPEALPWIVNVGVMCFVVAAAIIIDRGLRRW